MIEAPRIQALLPRHFKILELAAAGHDNVSIAKTLGISAHSVSLIINSTQGKMELARMRRESRETEILGLDRTAIIGKARSILEQASEKAALVQETLLTDEDPAIRLRSSQSILDRVFGKGEETRINVAVNVTAEQLTLLQLALKEANNGKVLPANTPHPSDSEVFVPSDELRECEGVNDAAPVDSSL